MYLRSIIKTLLLYFIILFFLYFCVFDYYTQILNNYDKKIILKEVTNIDKK